MGSHVLDASRLHGCADERLRRVSLGRLVVVHADTPDCARVPEETVSERLAFVGAVEQGFVKDSNRSVGNVAGLEESHRRSDAEEVHDGSHQKPKKTAGKPASSWVVLDLASACFARSSGMG